VKKRVCETRSLVYFSKRLFVLGHWVLSAELLTTEAMYTTAFTFRGSHRSSERAQQLWAAVAPAPRSGDLGNLLEIGVTFMTVGFPLLQPTLDVPARWYP
jgi:hypothetical protein